MPRISLTDFVEIVSTSGTRKARKIRQIKHRPKYQPAFDFYKPIRDRIVEIHKRDLPKISINQILVSISDPKKIDAYSVIINGYRKWWGRKTFEWFEPADIVYNQHGIDVSINPELGLEVNGTPHLIKLYFKSEPLAKNRIDVITHLMETCLRRHCPDETVMSVLDLRNSKLIAATHSPPTLQASLDAELAYIAVIWPQL